MNGAAGLAPRILKLMAKRRTPRRTTDLPNLPRLSRIHDYFQANDRCTQKQAIIFMDETKAMVEKYSAIRSFAIRTIIAVIPAEGWHTDTPQPQPHQRHTIV